MYHINKVSPKSDKNCTVTGTHGFHVTHIYGTHGFHVTQIYKLSYQHDKFITAGYIVHTFS